MNKKINTKEDAYKWLSELEAGAMIPLQDIVNESARISRIPLKYVCFICGKPIAVYIDPKIRFYGRGILDVLPGEAREPKVEGLYCPDCWNLKKLKE